MPFSALSISRGASDNVNSLDSANTARLIALQTTLSTLTYRSTGDLQAFLHRYGPKLFVLLKDVRAWLRDHPYEFAALLGGSMLLVLSCVAPLILGAMGFSAIGPVAGSIAAGWQASLGSAASGSLFAFLQSAAMGGAAMAFFTGIGLVGVGVAVAGGLAAVRGKMAGLLGRSWRWAWKRKED